MAGSLSRELRAKADALAADDDIDYTAEGTVVLLRVAAERLEYLGDLEGVPRAEGLQGRPAASLGGDTPAARELRARAEYANRPPDNEETERAMNNVIRGR